MSEIMEKSSNHSENEWINWLEDGIKKEHIRFYKYNQFNNIKKIGSGGFGKVYRANWNDTGNVLALKSFEYEFITVKEIINELNLQRKVDFHENVIRFFGITKACNENEYMIVMECADGGSLKDYLIHNFNNLTWENKYQFAYQIAIALECLHCEGIVHRDLNSNNILVHQNKIKLADFGLSRRIEETKAISKLFGVIPYVDPGNIQNITQNYKLSKESDIYSLGVLFWEISSGRPPFKNMIYDVYLAVQITKGLRETIVEDTPLEYYKLYTECWDGKQDNRPTIRQVVIKLKAIMSQKNKLPVERKFTIVNNPSQEVSQVVQNLDSIDLTGYTHTTVSSIDSNLLQESSQSAIKNDDKDLSEFESTNEENLNYIEEFISVKHIEHFEYKYFTNIQEIGSGRSTKVYRANFKSPERYLALKSFFNLDALTIKEIAREIELQREVDLNHVIRFYGMTAPDEEEYLLVMECADGGSLQDYLKENFKNLTWEDKYKLAYQLANAVSSLHNKGIVHGDLHSKNVLIHQNTIKLADFGLSKRIADGKQQSDLFGIVPYIDPKKFHLKESSYSFNEKNDVYSIGVLLWEISSGKLPFYVKSGILAHEKIIPGTPEDYSNIYTECWNYEPDDRPTMEQVVAKLNSIITKTKDFRPDICNTVLQLINEQQPNPSKIGASLGTNNLLDEELSRVIQNFGEMDIKEIEFSISTIEKAIKKNHERSDDITNGIPDSVPFPPQITVEEILDRRNRRNNETSKAPNNFMIYRMAYAKELKTQNINNINSYHISRIAGILWAKESADIKQVYKDLSDKVRDKLEETRKNS